MRSYFGFSGLTGSDSSLWDFKKLIIKEHQLLDEHRQAGANGKPAPGAGDIAVAPPGAAKEPWVAFTRRDRFGLALSGGGIRSATFNLGLLQGLHRKGLLQHVDYLSTVSGGGYVGGFWSAWLKRAKEQHPELQPPPIFPHHPDEPGVASFHCGAETNQSADIPVKEMREAGEFRHLREFSRFLMPRVGFSYGETWSAIITILSGVGPALLGTLALLTVLTYVWYGIAFLLFREPMAASLSTLVAGTFGLQMAFELTWRARGTPGDAAGPLSDYALSSIAIACLTGAGWFAWGRYGSGTPFDEWLTTGLSTWHDRLPRREQVFEFSAVSFGPAIAWSLTALTLMAARFLFSRRNPAVATASVIERGAYRCLGPAVVWTAVASAWELCRWLQTYHWPVSTATTGTITFSSLFLLVRHWLAEPGDKNRASRLLERLAIRFKPLAPQLFAYGAVLFLVLLVMCLVQQHGLGRFWRVRLWFGGATAALGLIIVCFNPVRVGLHDFYRARIARCFLGAARPLNAADNRATFEQAQDDLFLHELSGPPIHLVCCAANDLSGDSLSGLYRGARSAVLSRHGLSFGNVAARLEEVRLSSALTASAAAFNSQMGRISKHFGPAVAILMCAFNLRLGLWVPHPLNPQRGVSKFPGLFFFMEMFGFTACEPVEQCQCAPEISSPGRPLGKVAQSVGRQTCYVHLSDGGHFENLALYELVRRHCRYIIVSDCSADPQVAFDDLANALRKAREDFGVEIELDISPLRPAADKRSVQHAVIGTIYYNGLEGTDQGTILYFKPTLTGDEPPDILQYQTRNLAFPHESTGDQFYDEAQWESYRRLGEHSAMVVMNVIDQATPRPNFRFVDGLFLDLSSRWHAAPPQQDEVFLQLTERCADLETDVRENAPASLRHEFFPETLPSPQQPAGAIQERDESRIIYFLMLVAQVMEDAWLGAQLDTFWSHPLNQGWMHYFQRWASTPSFRRWWPIIRPVYSQGFADFVRDRFDLQLRDTQSGRDSKGPGAKLTLINMEQPEQLTEGLAGQHWKRRYGEIPHQDKSVLLYLLELEQVPNAASVPPLQVGFLLYSAKVEDGRKIIEWATPHLFVPHSLIGAGIVARFLDALIARFCSFDGVEELQVRYDEISGPQPGRGDPARALRRFRRDAASRLERVSTINFYKSRGFLYMRPDQTGELTRLSLDLQLARAERATRTRQESSAVPIPPGGLSASRHGTTANI